MFSLVFQLNYEVFTIISNGFDHVVLTSIDIEFFEKKICQIMYFIISLGFFYVFVLKC